MEAARDERKTQINSAIKHLREKAQEKRKEIEQINQARMEVQVQAAGVKTQLQTNVDQIIAIIEARKWDVFDVVDKQGKKSLEPLSQKKGEVENQVRLIESAIEQTDSLLKRSNSVEILAFSETFETILQEANTRENGHTECSPRIRFNRSEKVIDLLKREGIGNLKTVYDEIKTLQLGGKGGERSKVLISGEKEATVLDTPFEAEVPRRFRPVLSFGQKGKSIGMLDGPCGVAVNDRDEIALTDCFSNRVSLFSSDSTHLRSFGREGQKNGEFKFPTGIASDSLGNILVADCCNHRVQIFDENGNFPGTFGEQKSQNHKFKSPRALSINDNGEIIVADSGNKLIKIFSPSGEYLRNFVGASTFVTPYHCIQLSQHFIVSEWDDHSIKMFDLEGKFISKFGKQGNKDGEFNYPRSLLVSKEGLLLVCDCNNHRVQVFRSRGKFFTKFGSNGSEKGNLKYPNCAANLSDGRIVVCDSNNDNRIQVFEYK